MRRSVEVLLDGGCDRVLVVVGAAGDQVAGLLDDPGWSRRDEVTVVPCPGWSAGLSASLAAGLGAVTADVAVVHLVDLPDVPAAAVRRLLEDAGQGRAALARATYAGRPGHPVLVGVEHVATRARGPTSRPGVRCWSSAATSRPVSTRTGRDPPAARPW